MLVVVVPNNVAVNVGASRTRAIHTLMAPAMRSQRTVDGTAGVNAQAMCLQSRLEQFRIFFTCHTLLLWKFDCLLDLSAFPMSVTAAKRCFLPSQRSLRHRLLPADRR